MTWDMIRKAITNDKTKACYDIVSSSEVRGGGGTLARLPSRYSIDIRCVSNITG